MRMILCGLSGLLALFLSGCASSDASRHTFIEVPPASSPGRGAPDASDPAPTVAANPAPQAPTPELIVTPDNSLEGKVASVNDEGRFVVLKFPLGRMPATDSTLVVYRNGVKVGELKVTGPQKDDHIVADIRMGDCRVADAVRDR